MKAGDTVLVLQMDDEYRGRLGVVVELSRSLARVRFTDGTERYYNNMDGMDIQKEEE